MLSETDIIPIIPNGSWYFSIDVSKYLKEEYKSSLILAEKILEQSNVAVAPGEDFGQDNIFRISLTSSRVLEGVKRIVEYFKNKH